MGWNDVMGNLSRARHENGTPVTNTQRRKWARKVMNGNVMIIRSEKEYCEGMTEAAKAFLAGKRRTFRGPKKVRKYLRKWVKSYNQS
jgi:hypothetical protein